MYSRLDYNRLSVVYSTTRSSWKRFVIQCIFQNALPMWDRQNGVHSTPTVDRIRVSAHGFDD